MKLSEATRLVGMLFAYFPNADVPEDTLALWAREIQEFQTEDAMEAAHILGTSGKWTPALSEFLDAIRDVRNVRMANERKALPPVANAVGPYCTLEEFLRDNPDMAARVEALGAWGATLKRIGGVG